MQRGPAYSQEVEAGVDSPAAGSTQPADEDDVQWIQLPNGVMTTASQMQADPFDRDHDLDSTESIGSGLGDDQLCSLLDAGSAAPAGVAEAALPRTGTATRAPPPPQPQLVRSGAAGGSVPASACCLVSQGEEMAAFTNCVACAGGPTFL